MPRPKRIPTSSSGDPGTDLTVDRILDYLTDTAQVTTPSKFTDSTLNLLREHGAVSHAIYQADVTRTLPAFRHVRADRAWMHTFGNLARHLTPERLHALIKPDLQARAPDQGLTREALLASRDVRCFDAAGSVAVIYGKKSRRRRPSGVVLAAPIPLNDNGVAFLLAHMPPERERVTRYGLAPLIRTALRHAPTTDRPASRWLAVTPREIVAASAAFRRKHPDLDLAPGKPLKETLPKLSQQLALFEAALLTQPTRSHTTILETRALLRDMNGMRTRDLVLEVTAVRQNAERYLFLARSASPPTETTEALSDVAITAITADRVGLHITLDRHGFILTLTETATDHLGWDKFELRGMPIAYALGEEAATHVDRLKRKALEALHDPNEHGWVAIPETVRVAVTARSGATHNYDLSVTLLRNRVDDEHIPAGFMVSLHLTDDHVRAYRHLVQNHRTLRHDRRTTLTNVYNIAMSVLNTPGLSETELQHQVRTIVSEVRIDTAIHEEHEKLFEHYVLPTHPDRQRQYPRLDLGGLARTWAREFAHYYARHSFLDYPLSAPHVTVHVEQQRSEVLVYGPGPAAATHALRNLIANAVKYSSPDPGTGRRRINVTVTADPEAPDQARLTVTNTATGLTSEDVERAWQPGVRLNNSRTAPGSGMGLHLTKRYVEDAGGRVGAYLHPDETHVSFYFAFPLVRAAPPHNPTLRPHSSPGVHDLG